MGNEEETDTHKSANTHKLAHGEDENGVQLFIIK